MSEEELNQELSTDELKDVAGGATAIEYGLIAAMHEKQVKGSTNSPMNSDRLDKKGKKNS